MIENVCIRFPPLFGLLPIYYSRNASCMQVCRCAKRPEPKPRSFLKIIEEVIVVL